MTGLRNFLLPYLSPVLAFPTAYVPCCSEVGVRPLMWVLFSAGLALGNTVKPGWDDRAWTLTPQHPCSYTVPLKGSIPLLGVLPFIANPSFFFVNGEGKQRHVEEFETKR